MTEDRYDVLVAGGGLAGIAAATASARLGARTLLIERYGFLGGMATAGLVNPFMSYQTSTGKTLVAGVFTELCQRMRRTGGMLDRAFDPEAMKFAAQEMLLEAGAEMLLHSCVTGARVDGSRIVGLEVLTRSGAITVDGGCVVDASGDGDVSAMAGVPFEQGDENGKAQALTLMFTLGNVDLKPSLMYAKDHPDQMRFPRPSSEEQIDKMLEGVVAVAGFYDLVEAAREKGSLDLPQDMVFFINLPRRGEVVVNTTHVGVTDPTDSVELTRAEIEGRRQAMALVSFFRESIPGFSNSYLVQTATQIGIREARRILGEYVYTAEDVGRGAKFPDCILRSAYPVDVHRSAGKGYSKSEESSTSVAPPPGDWYEVPYRCLVPLKVENLLVAGRCVSATHEGHGAIRIMPNCTALGQAAGTAAALSVLNEVSPRQLDASLLRRILQEVGAIV